MSPSTTTASSFFSALLPLHPDLRDGQIEPRRQPHAAHLHRRMTAPVRCGVNIVEPKRGGDQPGIEAGHMTADHADRRPVQFVDQPPRRIDRITRPDRPIGKTRRADRGRRDDRRIAIELVEPDQPDAAIVKRHLAKAAVLGHRIATAATGRQEQPADKPRLHIIHHQHSRHVFPARGQPSSCRPMIGRVRSCRGMSRTSSRPPWLRQPCPDRPECPTTSRRPCRRHRARAPCSARREDRSGLRRLSCSQRIEAEVDHLRHQAQRQFVDQQQAAARPSAPGRSPASAARPRTVDPDTCVRRSCQTREKREHAIALGAVAIAGKGVAADRQIFVDVRSENNCRPSGTSAMPRRTRSTARRRVTSAPSKQDAAAMNVDMAHDRHDGRGLAGAVRSEQARESNRCGNVEADVAHGLGPSHSRSSNASSLSMRHAAADIGVVHHRIGHHLARLAVADHHRRCSARSGDGRRASPPRGCARQAPS